MGNLTGWHLIIVLVVILLLFGATRLPALSRSLGQSIKIFRKEVKTEGGDAKGSDDLDAASGSTSATPTAQRSASATEPGSSADKT